MQLEPVAGVQNEKDGDRPMKEPKEVSQTPIREAQCKRQQVQEPVGYEESPTVREQPPTEAAPARERGASRVVGVHRGIERADAIRAAFVGGQAAREDASVAI
jgi:hypothetical protein